MEGRNKQFLQINDCLISDNLLYNYYKWINFQFKYNVISAEAHYWMNINLRPTFCVKITVISMQFLKTNLI